MNLPAGCMLVDVLRAELQLLYAERDLLLSRDYKPGDWNRFHELNSRIASYARDLLFPGHSVSPPSEKPTQQTAGA